MSAIEDKAAIVVVASYRSVSRNPVGFKAVYDQIFMEGKGWWMGRGGSSERCLKWGGGGWGVIKRSFQKHLKTGGRKGESCS